MSLGGTIRDLLYSEQNFDAVEDKLERRFAGASEPMKASHYSALINALSTTRFSDSPERLLDVLNSWVEAKRSRIARCW